MFTYKDFIKVVLTVITHSRSHIGGASIINWSKICLYGGGGKQVFTIIRLCDDNNESALL